ncbi:MAG: protein kinase [Archangium sp.]|nr:protein kinase [Archangium sp.]
MISTPCIDEEQLLAWVDRALPPDDATRVGAHVAECAECRTVVAALARDEDATIERPPPLRRGVTLGRYVLGDRLGAGGMGVVYSAEDPTLGRRVAIKLLREQPFEGERTARAARFEHERRILAKLDHPHITRLLDGGETESGAPYLVMELVTGTPLVEFCDAKSLDVPRRLALFLEVCGAVQFAHQHLIVHRDLKPSNILVTEDGSTRLLDFGIAKLLDPDEAQLTATGVQPMTPAFASPEQVRRDAITTATDVYALGVILYELLTGRSPYGDAEKSGIDAVLLAVRDHEPARPSGAVSAARETDVVARAPSRRALEKVLEGDLDAIVLKALRKEPRERYASAEQFADDVRRHLEGRPALARRGSTAYVLSRFVRRHKVAVVGAGAALISLSAGTVATAYQAHVASLARERAERRFTQVRQLAHSVLFDYHDGIAQLEGSTALRERLVKDALVYLESLAGEAGDDAALQRELASAFIKVGDVQGDPFSASLGDTGGALKSYRRAQDIALALPQTDVEARRMLALARLKVGDLLSVTGDAPGALASYAEAIAVNEVLAKNSLDDAAELSMDLLAQATVQLEHSKLDEALSSMKRCIELREQVLAARPGDAVIRRRVLAAHVLFADILSARKEIPESLAEYGRTLEAYEALVRDATQYQTDLGPLYQRVGKARREAGDVDGGVVLLAKSLEVALARVAADPVDTVGIRNLAGAYSTLADAQFEVEPAAAISNYAKVVDSVRQLRQADPANEQIARDLVNALETLAESQRKKGSLALALNAVTESVALAEEQVKKAPRSIPARGDLAEALLELGRVELAMDQMPAARTNLSRASELFERLVADAPENADFAQFRQECAALISAK